MLAFFFIVFAFLVVAFLALVATVGVTLTSLATLLTAPGQLAALLRNKTLRRNHALEHATINVIEERYGPTRLAGLAREEGFVIRGGASPDLVASAAEEALARLRAGERRLAIHPRCGTTLVAAQLVMAVAFIAALALTRELSLLPFAIGIVAALVIGPRLSPLLQRFVTTDANVGSMTITGVEIQPVSNPLGLVSMFAFGPVLVRTSQDGYTGHGERVTLVTPEYDEIPVTGYRVR